MLVGLVPHIYPRVGKSTFSHISSLCWSPLWERHCRIWMERLDSGSQPPGHTQQLDRFSQLCRCRSSPLATRLPTPPLPADPDSQGPITEEIIFRSLITQLHLLSRLSPTKTIFLTPLYFGIAHIHHFYEYKLTNPREETLPVLLRSLFQFTYTTLFGWYATFVFIRTGSLAAVVVAHSFCNWCGLPRLWGRVEPEAYRVLRESIKNADKNNGPNYTDGAGRGRFQNCISECFAMRWSVAYYVLLVAGAIAFQRGLWLLTESEGALAQIDWLMFESLYTVAIYKKIGEVRAENWLEYAVDRAVAFILCCRSYPRYTYRLRNYFYIAL